MALEIKTKYIENQFVYSFNYTKYKVQFPSRMLIYNVTSSQYEKYDYLLKIF